MMEIPDTEDVTKADLVECVKAAGGCGDEGPGF